MHGVHTSFYVHIHNTCWHCSLGGHNDRFTLTLIYNNYLGLATENHQKQSTPKKNCKVGGMVPQVNQHLHWYHGKNLKPQIFWIASKHH